MEIYDVVREKIRELNVQLTLITDKMREIRGLYPYLDKLNDIKQAELKELLEMCEGSMSENIFRFRQKLKLLQEPRLEGRLTLKPEGCFALGSRELSAGDYLEVFVPVSKEEENTGWHFGKIEYDGKKMCFQGRRLKLPLKEGMLVAVRTKKNNNPLLFPAGR